MSKEIKRVSEKLQAIKKGIADLLNQKSNMEHELDEATNLDLRHMTKQERIEATWALPALSPSHMATIQESGFITGSSNIISNPNDIDWCVNLPPTVFRHHALGANNQDYWEQNSFSSLYAHYEGTLINLLCFSNMDLMNAWYVTTQAMNYLAKFSGKKSFFYATSSSPPSCNDLLRNAMLTKWKRIRIFRAIRDVLYNAPLLENPMTKSDALKYNK